MTEDGIAQLKRDEGFRPHGYFCPTGHLTIGYGIMIDERRGGGITEEEAEYLLKNRVAKIAAELKAHFPYWEDLGPTRQDALINMAYQLGVKGLLKFTNMLLRLELKQYDRAATEALASKWARQTPERAKRIAALIKGD